jgi:hypothetical protein
LGFLGGESPGRFASRLRAFRQGLSETDYVAGRNAAIEYRWAENQVDRLPALAADRGAPGGRDSPDGSWTNHTPSRATAICDSPSFSIASRY